MILNRSLSLVERDPLIDVNKLTGDASQVTCMKLPRLVLGELRRDRVYKKPQDWLLDRRAALMDSPRLSRYICRCDVSDFIMASVRSSANKMSLRSVFLLVVGCTVALHRCNTLVEEDRIEIQDRDRQ